MARRAAARGGRALPDDERGRERTARALLRRGFSRGAVARVLGGKVQESDDSGHDDEFEADS